MPLSYHEGLTLNRKKLGHFGHLRKLFM